MICLRISSATLTSLVVVWLGTTVAWATQPAAKASPFKGRTVTVVVASPAGSEYHRYASLLVDHMGQHIAGGPALAIRNMSREGGIGAVNYIYDIAPRDGTVIAAVRRSAPLQETVSAPGVLFRSAELNWIGSLDTEIAICTALGSKNFTKLEDPRAPALVVGVSGPSYLAVFPQILKNTLGINLTIVSHFASQKAVADAMADGYIDAMCSSYSAQKARNPRWFSEGRARVLIQLGTKSVPELEHVPTASSFAKDRVARMILQSYLGALEMGRPFASPPGVPAERIAMLRQAFNAMTTDQRFGAAAQAQKLQITPRSGEAVQEMVQKIMSLEPWIRAKLKEDLRPQVDTP